MKITLLIFLLTIPAFFRMLRPGIFLMQDFHLFRLFEFDRCFRDLQLPCRWAVDAGFGYGEPVFNFYTQVPYLIGQLFHLFGLQFVDSIKILFILSIVGSAWAMFLLAKQIWGTNLSAVLSAVVYVYAPYRAVDVWVRGALPEAMAFVIFPLIIFFVNDFYSTKRLRSLALLGFLLGLLLVNHNLSFLMFIPFLVVWIGFLSFSNKKWKLILPIISSFILALFISAFYLLPVIFESRFVHLDLTIKGYFDFRAHFVTLYQIFISRFWGYGASLFGPIDDISLSIGQIQWLLPIVVLLGFIIKAKKTTGLPMGGLLSREGRSPERQLHSFDVKLDEKIPRLQPWSFIGKKKDWKRLMIIILIGWFALFMSHNKSTPIWEGLPFLAYMQFPWRWFSIATFSFAIASGGFALLFRDKYRSLVICCTILLTILVNMSFFREDIWKNIGDKEIFSGKLWEEQISASLPDYWPTSAKDLPSGPPREEITLVEGEGFTSLVSKKSFRREYKINIDSEKGKVEFPIVFFPGWTGKVNGDQMGLYPSGSLGLITADFSKGSYSVLLTFKDTPIRTAGNLISMLSFVVFILLLKVFKSKQYGR